MVGDMYPKMMLIYSGPSLVIEQCILDYGEDFVALEIKRNFLSTLAKAIMANQYKTNHQLVHRNILTKRIY